MLCPFNPCPLCRGSDELFSRDADFWLGRRRRQELLEANEIIKCKYKSIAKEKELANGWFWTATERYTESPWIGNLWHCSLSVLWAFVAMIVCAIKLIITMLQGGTRSGGFINRSYAWIRGHPRPKTDERLGLSSPVPS